MPSADQLTETNGEPSAAPRATSRYERIVIVLALAAAAVRLIPLQWLHPLQWDELEFFRAARWVAEGKIPFRDFWEHHTPLTWFVFAPVAAFVKSSGVTALLVMRWAQVPVWIAAFWLVNLWMRGAGISRFARWAAIAAALTSSLFMIQAVEYRIEALACALLAGGLVFVQRNRMFGAGALLCMTVFANIRFAPAVVVIALLAWLIRPDSRKWSPRRALVPLAAGTLIAGFLWLVYFFATDSFLPFVQQVWVDNLAERHAEPVARAFMHRLLLPFGVRLIGEGSPFDLARVDPGGVIVLLAGAAGIGRALLSWRRPERRFLIAAVAVAALVFIASMKFVYHYHFALVVILLVPLIAAVVDELVGKSGPEAEPAAGRRRAAGIISLLAVSLAFSTFASVFRGKELDRAYQDRIMREVHRRTDAGESVWSGIPWALHREPAYHFWFLPELTRHLVRHEGAAPYALVDAINDPPAAIVFDHNALVWVATVQRELAPYFVRHYVPVWRNLWLPGMNGVVPPGQARQWIVPRDGAYAVFSDPALANHLWFHDPLLVARHHGPDAAQFTLELPPPTRPTGLHWLVDGEAAEASRSLVLRKGEVLTAVNGSSGPIAVIVYAGQDRVLFRQPPPGVTLEGETPRVTHWPRFGAKIE
jgi:hypothetical protein